MLHLAVAFYQHWCKNVGQNHFAEPNQDVLTCMDLLLLVVVTDMSSTVFIEPKPVLEFIHDLLHKDLTRSLTDSDRVKV